MDELAQSKEAVAARGITKKYPSGDAFIYALRGVNLDAHTNEILMIVGPSGCGKTTLLSIIAGTLPFDQGEAEVFGHSLNHMNEEELTLFRRKYIGFVFQQYQLIKSISVLDNVSIPLILNGFSRPEAKKQAQEILEKVGLNHKGSYKPNKLSGGEQQRVAIARALIHRPALMICDEPTAALDIESGTKVMELIKEIAVAPDRCVIIVTHDNRIFKYADQIVEMEDGIIKGEVDV